MKCGRFVGTGLPIATHSPKYKSNRKGSSTSQLHHRNFSLAASCIHQMESAVVENPNGNDLGIEMNRLIVIQIHPKDGRLKKNNDMGQKCPVASNISIKDNEVCCCFKYRFIFKLFTTFNFTKNVIDY